MEVVLARETAAAGKDLATTAAALVGVVSLVVESMVVRVNVEDLESMVELVDCVAAWAVRLHGLRPSMRKARFQWCQSPARWPRNHQHWSRSSQEARTSLALHPTALGRG